MALMQIDGRWFRKLSEDFLIMRRMISAYRMAVLDRLAEANIISKQYIISSAGCKKRERNTLKDMEDIQTGNPGEAGHTGAGIKPGGRYD
jgi:hypothetical protein